jgi:hypothetical protein
VTGRIVCSDTQRAARLATVTLVAVEQLSQNGGGGFGRRVMAHTDLDGNFSVQAEPGDYYALATAVGYVSTVAGLSARLDSGATAADLLSRIPQVHVAEGSGGSVNLTLDRGAAVAGKLVWDDGTPAAGVNVNALSTTASFTPGVRVGSDLARVTAQLGGMAGGFQISDDRGVFRITGLAPGAYYVRATVMTPSAEPNFAGYGQRMDGISLYAPGKVRRGDAQTVTLKLAEERDDLVFTLNLGALHTVSGHATSADGSGNVASGMVRLTDSQDSTLNRQAQIQPDGSFMLQWVPAGSYTLTVMGASAIPNTQSGRRGQTISDSGSRYQRFQESLTVADSDLSGVNLSLVRATGQRD